MNNLSIIILHNDLENFMERFIKLVWKNQTTQSWRRNLDEGRRVQGGEINKQALRGKSC